MLRDGLSWHDGKPVTAADCAASLVRWGKRDAMGQLMFTAVESCTGRDAKTLEIKLTRPYGLLIDSIAKISSNVPFMMPKEIAETDPFKQIENAIGSGPFIFRKEQWVPGSKVVYDKNPNYVPRKEPASGAAGGKIAKVDRVEWLYIPDPTTCMNALMSGEVDYYEQVPADLAPMLAKAPGVKIETLDPIGSQGMMRFNHLVAPTNNPLVRRAIMRAISQKDVLAAAIGNPEYYKECASIYPCGSPFESNAGTNLVSPPSLAEAKKLLTEAGYKGEKTVILQPSDIPNSNAFALVVAKACRDIGMNVDLQSLDWSSVTSRRAKKDRSNRAAGTCSRPGGSAATCSIRSATLRSLPIRKGLAGVAERPEARGAARCVRRRERPRGAEEGRRRRAAARDRDRHRCKPRHLLRAGRLPRQRQGHDPFAGAVLLEHGEGVGVTLPLARLIPGPCGEARAGVLGVAGLAQSELPRQPSPRGRDHTRC